MKIYVSNDGILSVSDFNRGADFSLALRATNKNELGVKTPINLTGVTMASELRKKDDTLVAILTITITDAEDGRYKITGTPTGAWPIEDLYFDVLATNADTSTWWALPRSVLRVKDSATGSI